jgi:ribosomal protein S18 acetylase RimI-like enzyme
VDRITIVDADLARSDHAEGVISQLDEYSRDEVANCRALPEDVKRDLVPGLRAHPGTYVFLAYDEDRAIGVAVCFLGFSTFAARRLMNVHDLAVTPAHRGRGIARMLLERVEERARELGCCKLTLEVQENNVRAKRLYARLGFAGYELAADAGHALFWQKKL